MKKIMIIGLIVLVFCSMIYANGTSENQKKKLTVWYEKSFSDESNLLMEKRFEEFGKEKNVDIEYEMINALDLMQKLNATIEAGNAPDIVYLNKYKVLSYGNNNPFMDVTEIIESLSKNRAYMKSAVEGTKIAGKNYFIPFYASNDLLFVRKDLLDAKGIAIPKTWDELFKAAIAVSEPEKGIYGFGMGCGPNDEDGCNTFRIINWSQGGGLYSRDGKIIANTDKVTYDTVSKYKELFEAGAIPPAATTWGPSGNNASYLSGESAMVLNTATLYNAMKKDPKYAELLENTIVSAPPAGKAGTVYLGLMTGFGITKASKNVETAKEFISFMNDKTWYDEYVSLIAPVFSSVFDDAKDNPLYSTDVNNAALTYSINASGYYGYPVETYEGQILASTHYYQFPICELLNNVVAKNMSVQDALDNLAKQTAEVRENI